MAIGIWPANAIDDDTVTISVSGNETITTGIPRQQSKKAAGQTNISLADFVAPADSGKQDYSGAFSVTIEGIEKHISGSQPNWMIIIRSYCRLSRTVLLKHWQK